MRYQAITRSENALTIEKAVHIDDVEVFIKVATADTQTSADSVSIDAINSIVMNHLDPAHDWTIIYGHSVC
jgi:hypothetical protein